MDFNTPFLTRQIIAYIGNKRRLLDLIYRSMKSCIPDIRPGLRFFDVFAGSGVVSRLAKSLEFELFTNDWEYYSYILACGFIKTDQDDIAEIFGSDVAFRELLEDINNLPDPSEDDQYIAKYYAPESFDIDKADFRRERLFYTRNNALTIDKIRNYIEINYPEGTDDTARNILLGLLLYESATHTNTSGVFKAFHKGFGGHNKDAMKRIASPIQLKPPVLINSGFPVHVFNKDSNQLVRNKEVGNIDIAYLDPPYNQHQYGSNYHMLNTIGLWDRIPAPLMLNEKGTLKEKAAIRKDWIKTKSDYCYRDSAVSAFTGLLENLDARHILVSYSTDGIIPFETMKEICGKRGRLSIVTDQYTKYRGGKQSNSRLNTNIEFILTIDTEKRSTIYSAKEVESVVMRKKILLMFKQRYSKSRLQSCCSSINGEDICFDIGSREVTIRSNSYFELFPFDDIDKLSVEESGILYEMLLNSACRTKEEELHEILSKISGNTGDNRYFLKLIPDTLKKLAHKKNRESFKTWLGRVREMEKARPDIYPLIKNRIEKIELIAEKRFNN